MGGARQPASGLVKIMAAAALIPKADNGHVVGAAALCFARARHVRLRRCHATLYVGAAVAKGSPYRANYSLRERPDRFARIIGMQSNNSMTDAPSDPQEKSGIAGVLLAHRPRILHFLRLRGAADAAEDLFQELWLRLSQRESDDIADPLSYVMRAANNLMLDRYRSNRQRELRDTAWGELRSVTEASAENQVIAQQQLAQLQNAIAAVGARPARIFYRFRFDAIPQKDIAAEMAISLSTVEADLRKVYAAIAAIRRQFDAQ